MASNSEVIMEEIEALEAIMMDEVNIHYNSSGQPNAVEVTVKPATAQNVEEQYVRVTLIVKLPPQYPDESPTMILKNPRGIDDDVLQLINVESHKKCDEFLGLPVIYELIEVVREKLTANNTPSCPCAICLFYFTNNDHFSKTPCFHYFHSHCLGRYILNCEETAAAEEKENQQPVWMAREKRQLLCPVCREPLIEQFQGVTLLKNPPPEEGEILKDFSPNSPEIKQLQEKMSSLYLHQKSKGGIIDLEEEKNKFLISATVNNIESFGREEDALEMGSPQANKERDSAKETSVNTKSNNQNRSNSQLKRGGGGGGSSSSSSHNHNQGKREYSSGGYGWWNGNKYRGGKKGGKMTNAGNNVNKQNSIPSDSQKFDREPNHAQCVDERFSNQKPPRQLEKKNQGRYGHNDNRCDPKYPSQNVDYRLNVHSRQGRGHMYRNSSHRGGKPKGPPPGFSELESTVSPHATS